MPVFDYQCGYCETIYETVLFKSDSVPICPSCEADDHQTKQFSAPARLICPQDDYPKDDHDLRNYIGNGEYNAGYKRKMYD